MVAVVQESGFTLGITFRAASTKLCGEGGIQMKNNDVMLTPAQEVKLAEWQELVRKWKFKSTTQFCQFCLRTGLEDATFMKNDEDVLAQLVF